MGVSVRLQAHLLGLEAFTYATSSYPTYDPNLPMTFITLNPKPYTHNPKPQTQNPEP